MVSNLKDSVRSITRVRRGVRTAFAAREKRFYLLMLPPPMWLLSLRGVYYTYIQHGESIAAGSECSQIQLEQQSSEYVCACVFASAIKLNDERPRF